MIQLSIKYGTHDRARKIRFREQITENQRVLSIQILVNVKLQMLRQTKMFIKYVLKVLECHLIFERNLRTKDEFSLFLGAFLISLIQRATNRLL